MNNKNYVSVTQLRIIEILKRGGWIEYWEDDPNHPEVEIANFEGKNHEKIRIQTFNILKNKNIIIKDHDLYLLDGFWILNKEYRNPSLKIV